MIWLRSRGQAGPPRRRAARVGLLVIATACVAAAGGLIAASRIKSPAQLAAEASAPPPTLLTATVTSQPIRNTVVFRGTVGNPRRYSALGVPGEPSADSSGAAASAVITAEPTRPGSVVHAGQVLVEISGRPVVILPGSIPAYRSMVPGGSGKDVAELQVALGRLGYDTGSDAAGSFGAGTKTAVARWYRDLGYSVSEAGDPTAIQSARAALTQAERNLTTLQDSGAASSTNASAGPPSGGASPSAATGVPIATQISWAQQDVTTAQDQYDRLLQGSGAEVPFGEVMFVPTLPATLAAIGGAVGEAPKSPVVTIAVGSPAITGRLDPASAAAVHQGLAVSITDSLRGYQTRGTVSQVGTLTTDASGANPPYVPVTVTASLPQSLVGDDVQLNINASPSGPSDTLAVPAAGVYSQADGQLYVTALRPTNKQVRVAVRVGASGDGQVAITPLEAGQLKAGDTVVLGVGGGH